MLSEAFREDATRRINSLKLVIGRVAFFPKSAGDRKRYGRPLISREEIKMGKQLIQFFIECFWEHLIALRELHRRSRDQLIELWEALDSKSRSRCRKEFWQFMHGLERALESYRDGMEQYRDQCFARCLSSEDDFLPPGEYLWTLGGPLTQIYEDYRTAVEDSWWPFEEAMWEANLYSEKPIFRQAVRDLCAEALELKKAHLTKLGEAKSVTS